MDIKAVAMGVAFALMWSSAFVTARIIVADAPPLMALALRFAISGALATGIAAALGQTWRLSRAQGRAVLIFGLCQNAIYLGLNFVALQRIEASLAAIIASAMPLMVAALGWAVRGEQVGRLGLAGLIAGTAGVALIMGSRVTGGADPMSVMLCFVGATSLAVATLSVQGAAGGGNLLMVVGLQMLVGSGALALVALATETPVLRPSPVLLAAFVYQIVVPGVVATVLWFSLVQRIGMVRASAYHFLNPFFGVAIAWITLGERVGWLDIAGVGIVMAGILAVQMSRTRVPPPSPL